MNTKRFRVTKKESTKDYKEVYITTEIKQQKETQNDHRRDQTTTKRDRRTAKSYRRATEGQQTITMATSFIALLCIFECLVHES